MNNKRLNKSERELLILSVHLKNILVGVFLGDLYAQRYSKSSKNVQLQFAQGTINEAYLLHLYSLFKDFCLSPPKRTNLKPHPRTGKIYSRIRFSTLSLPCFYELYSLFYPSGIKIIPSNIGELLTEIGLAYWAQDDGSKSRGNFYLNTDCYTLDEVKLLIKVLKDNFGLDCSYHSRGISSTGVHRYRIWIKSNSMDKFIALVTPYFHDSMLYKLK
jgi:LAGLIDADG DNA endonuclease family